MNEVAVILPAYNEEKAIEGTITELMELVEPRQIIVINDGSNDKTSAVARSFPVTVIDLPLNMGIGIAMQTGYRWALANGWKYALQCDADGQHPATQIGRVIDCMTKSGVDMVIGSRFADSSLAGFKSLPLRRVAIRLLSTWVLLLTGKYIKDVTSGFRLVGHEGLQLFAAEYPFDYPEPESIILILNHNLQVAEVAVSMRDRQGGVSSISAMRGVYYIVKVALGLAITRLRRGR